MNCKTVAMVVPRGVEPRRHYGRAAIALALGLWALAGEPARAVRQRVCAWPVAGAAATGWPTLRRWADACGQALGLGKGRAAAGRFAQIAAGRAPPLITGPVWSLAYAGGAAMP